MHKDTKLNLYAVLEYDNDSGSDDFGLERINGSIELIPGLRLHGGWDAWEIDAIESASIVYGNDKPGLWLKGNFGSVAFSTAWLRLEENSYQNKEFYWETDLYSRNLCAGWFDYRFDATDKDKIRLFYAYDRIRNIPSLDIAGSLASGAGLADYAGIYGNNGITGSYATKPETDTHTIGGYYLGSFGIVTLTAEGVYKSGSADNTGLRGVDNGITTILHDDFRISSYALAADIEVELKDALGWHSFKPHMGIMYTSGDDNPDDDRLCGYTGVENANRYSGIWGSEYPVTGDTSIIMGTVRYGYLPEFHGNGTPVFTGGLQNFEGSGSGRGDNPGLTLYSFGITLSPNKYLIFRTNANIFFWNEDFYAANMVNPISITSSGLKKTRYTKVESGYAGTEWYNELTLSLSRHMFIRTHAAFFFPGNTAKEASAAFTGRTERIGEETALRVTAELIWNF
ncbi:MAG: hypothetical protein GY795_07090 [Desulfobacterales bacterium]|nr:hypothetical protein [Desulfobacterales bacterium]